MVDIRFEIGHFHSFVLTFNSSMARGGEEGGHMMYERVDETLLFIYAYFMINDHFVHTSGFQRTFSYLLKSFLITKLALSINIFHLGCVFFCVCVGNLLSILFSRCSQSIRNSLHLHQDMYVWLSFISHIQLKKSRFKKNRRIIQNIKQWAK